MAVDADPLTPSRYAYKAGADGNCDDSLGWIMGPAGSTISCSHRGGQGFESPQLHLWDLVSDQVRSSFLEPQPTSRAGVFGLVGRNLGDHLLPASRCGSVRLGVSWCLCV